MVKLTYLQCVRIHQAFAGDATQHNTGAISARKFERVVTEIEFTCIALQILCANMVINLGQSALQPAKKIFNRVSVNITTNILASAMSNCLMTSEG